MFKQHIQLLADHHIIERTTEANNIHLDLEYDFRRIFPYGDYSKTAFKMTEALMKGGSLNQKSLVKAVASISGGPPDRIGGHEDPREARRGREHQEKTDRSGEARLNELLTLK